ncbi:hypothetical protein H8959_007429 [Pygathrix nigripes]
MEAEESEKAATEHEPLEGTEQTLDAEEEQEESKEAACGGNKRVVPGIVYLGHISPRFSPLHVRNLLSAYGEVGRVFFQAEDQFVRRKKKAAAAAGGKKRSYSKDYSEGWVEFRDKRIAKRVAASLHNTPMGARRRSSFRYDLWNLKYLHHFTWSHLSEHLAFERQELRARKAARPGGRERARLATAQDKARSNKGLLARIFRSPTTLREHGGTFPCQGLLRARAAPSSSWPCSASCLPHARMIVTIQANILVCFSDQASLLKGPNMQVLRASTIPTPNSSLNNQTFCRNGNILHLHCPMKSLNRCPHTLTTLSKDALQPGISDPLYYVTWSWPMD